MEAQRLGGGGGKQKRRERVGWWGAHGETERMEAEGEPATGQVGDGEGRQLITPSPPPLSTPPLPLSSRSFHPLGGND